MVQGVMSVRDAQASIDAGAQAPYVSNYGARFIDRTPTTIDVLPAIRDAVGGDMPIILDSGIRRGSDIAAALALGANAVALGRLIGYGLARQVVPSIAPHMRAPKNSSRCTMCIPTSSGCASSGARCWP